MKAASSSSSMFTKDRKRKISSDFSDHREHERSKVPQSASRRHREKINATLEELGSLLPLSDDVKSKLDKLTVLKLSVSFFQTRNYLESGKRKQRVDSAAINEITKKFEECNISVSDISLEALDAFFIVLTEKADVFFVSENVSKYLGYTQAFLMHQNFLSFVHQDDVDGFKKCLERSTRATIVELDGNPNSDCTEGTPMHQVCFSSIRCHAGRQSSHVSPFYYRSFKFDGNIKPLLGGKMKQYGLFALCTPVNPANPLTSTPKELLQMYSCKMGLDLMITKLDNRGQKCLYLSEKDTHNNTAYLFAHPLDVPVLMLAHEQVNATGTTETVFRCMNGNGVWQWVRGKARILTGKNNQPEFIVADNVLLTDEQGPYYKNFVFEMLSEWKSNQRGLPSPESKEHQSTAEDSYMDSSPALSISTETRSLGEETASVAEVADSEKTKQCHVSRQASLNEKGERISSRGRSAGSPQSCMFTEPPLKKSAVITLDEQQSRHPVDETNYNYLKRERGSNEEEQISPVFTETTVDEQISLIKQFLMEVDPKVRNNSLLNGATSYRKPSTGSTPYASFPEGEAAVFTELHIEPTDTSSVVKTSASTALEMQPSFYSNPDTSPLYAPEVMTDQNHAQVNVENTHPLTSNLIFPFPAHVDDHELGSVGSQDIPGLATTTVHCNPEFISQNHSSQETFHDSTHGLYYPSDYRVLQKETLHSRDFNSSETGVWTRDYHKLASGTTFPSQNSGLFSTVQSNTRPFSQDLSMCQLENLNSDHLVSTLVPDNLTSFEDRGKYYNAPISQASSQRFLGPSSVTPIDKRNSVNHAYERQYSPTAARNSGSLEQSFHSGEDSILKMILTL